MFVNQIVSYGRAMRWVSVPAAALLLGACSMFRAHQEEAPQPSPVETTASAVVARWQISLRTRPWRSARIAPRSCLMWVAR